MSIKDPSGHYAARDAQDEDPLQALRREAAEVRSAKALVTVWRLLKDYKIPTTDSSGPLDLNTRLFLLVIALAETHPKHREREKVGAKTKWSLWSSAALLIEFERLLATGAKSQTAAAQTLATIEPWATLMRGNERPDESLRQEFVKARKQREADPHFKEIFLLVQKFAPESVTSRQRYIRKLISKKLTALPEMRIDTLLHQKSVKK